MNPEPQNYPNSTPNGVCPALLPQTPSPLYVGAGVLGLVWNYSLTLIETTISHRATLLCTIETSAQELRNLLGTPGIEVNARPLSFRASKSLNPN